MDETQKRSRPPDGRRARTQWEKDLAHDCTSDQLALIDDLLTAAAEFNLASAFRRPGALVELRRAAADFTTEWEEVG